MAALALSGCRQTAADGLVGRWEGQPDSAEAYRGRQVVARPDAPARSDPADGSAADALPVPSSPPFPDATQLEQYDVRVVLDFARDGTATMWLDEGRDRIAGRWRVVEANGRQMVVEIVAQQDDNRQTPERRRFELQWDEDADGFMLREEGADPQLGWLYFRRAESVQSPESRARTAAPGFAGG